MGSSSNTDGHCKKHHNHKQSNGVCPSCLRDKLSRLSTSTNASPSLSSPSSFDSGAARSSSSSSSSPRRRGRRVSFSAVLAAKPEPLTNTRSAAFLVATEEERGKGAAKARTEKGRSFWARLLVGNARKRRDGEGDLAAMHSNTLRETATSVSS